MAAALTAFEPTMERFSRARAASFSAGDASGGIAIVRLSARTAIAAELAPEGQVVPFDLEVGRTRSSGWLSPCPALRLATIRT